MQRRQFMKVTAAGLAGFSLVGPILGSSAHAKNKSELKTEPEQKWRTVELTEKITSEAVAPTEVWLPIPLAQASYQELISTNWTGNFAKAGIWKDKTYGAPIFYAQWDQAKKIELQVTHEVKLRNRIHPEVALNEDFALYLKSTEHIPLDGMVKETAQKIVKAEKNPDKIAKLIYNWMAENTYRDGKVRGCGLGDIKSLLVSGNLGGKCADLSSLFVGLCRASGVPAREVFGLRVLNSELSKSIGKQGDVSKAQHCRAEYYAAGAWVPVDPADVRKVILEENLKLEDPHVADLRRKLFGFWEMNWVAFNSARDFSLPPKYSENINYLMYPKLVAGSIQKDGMEPDAFTYSINSKEII